jgi:hypothetical protein
MATDASAPARKATRGEIITKFTTIPVFNLTNTETQQAFPTIDNPVGRPMGTFYTDLADAEEQVAKCQQLNPQFKLAIEAVPLSHAWALSERWVNEAPPPGVLRIQASKAVLESLPGFPGLPDELRSGFNPATSQMPLWQMDELHTDKEMPYFFHFEDMVDYWMAKSGRPREEFPTANLDVTDLRVLVARMVTQEERWDRMLLVPPRRTMQMTTQKMPDLPVPLDEGSEPPPLEPVALDEGSEPPPLEPC